MKILDLHGIKHHEVKQKCHIFINDHWGERVKIVTGHSKEMIKLVCEVLSFYSLQYSFDDFSAGGAIIVKE